MRKNKQFCVARDSRDVLKKAGLMKQLAARAAMWMGGERRTQREKWEKEVSTPWRRSESLDELNVNGGREQRRKNGFFKSRND